MTLLPSEAIDRLDPVFLNAVEAMLDRFDRAKGKGGYPTANEREAMRRVVRASRQAGEWEKVLREALDQIASGLAGHPAVHRVTEMRRIARAALNKGQADG